MRFGTDFVHGHFFPIGTFFEKRNWRRRTTTTRTTKLLLGPLSVARGQKFAVNEWSAVKNSVSTYGLFWLNLYTLIRKSASYSHTNTFCFSYRIERISYKKKGSRIETTWIEDILYNLYSRRNNVPYCNTYFHFWEMQKIIARNFNWKCDK